VSSDRDLDDFEPDAFVDPIGYPWTLERLVHVAARYRLGPMPDGLPPMTPIERTLFDAMRSRGLQPIPQYGIDRFRADFAFIDAGVVVECDGKPWHDPDRDRRRDAALRRHGWEPVHFTGSEIHRDAAACALRVERFVRERLSLVVTPLEPIAIPVRRGLWQRLIAWLRGLVRRPAAAGENASMPPRVLEVPARSAWTDRLDDDQRAAVHGHDGVVQVIACAGSGKTEVLVARVRELVARGVPPNRILCCTFNTAAAEELQSRLGAAGVEGVEATTFHAIGRRILKEADALRGSVATMPYGWWRRLAKQAMDATEEGVWIEAPSAKEQISGIKLGRMLTVEEFDELAATPTERTLAALYRAYEKTLEEQDQNDFDDYIFNSLRLLQRQPDVRRRWQERFSAVLVDEYQDIEPAQELLVQVMAAPEDLLFCVGDEDQCLYAWRRASVERVIELDQLYPGLERHALVRNYRCPKLVVDASRALIGHNRRRFPKRIEAARAEPGTITIVTAADLEAQASHAARLVKGVEQGQAVVLARTSRVLSAIAVGLAQAGIRFFGPERIKRQSGEPAVLLSYVRLLGQPETAREEDVDQVFRVPNRYLPNGAALNVASGLREGLSFTEAIRRLRIREEWRRPNLTEAGRLFDEMRDAVGAAGLVYRVRTDGGLDRYYASAEQLNPTDQSAVDSLEEAEDAAAGMSVREFADALDYQAHIIEQYFDPTGVELATIHGAKGRQWPLVIVAGVEQGELPHLRSLMNADDEEGELEGERRLAYVAFTRASGRLVLMHQAGAPSRFIAEAAPIAERDVAGMGDRPTLASTQSLGPRPRVRADAYGLNGVPDELRPRRRDKPFSAVGAMRPIAGHGASQLVAEDGSIPCSMPGCVGTVKAGFVIQLDTGPIGLCPKVEDHERIVARNPGLAEHLAVLKKSNSELKREWVARNGNGQVRSLTNGAIRCSFPGCGGIVKPDFVFRVDGVERGLCGQQWHHLELADGDPAVAAELDRLEELQAEIKGIRRRAAHDLGGALLAEGGIPCSVPGCDGVVGPGFVIRREDGDVGLCGNVANHARLVALDPRTRDEFARLQVLEAERRRAWGKAMAEVEDELEAGLEDLPF
jgi:DNA helicase-2/ATP-dependent DNA helicase PcrA